MFTVNVILFLWKHNFKIKKEKKLIDLDFVGLGTVAGNPVVYIVAHKNGRKQIQ